MNNKNYLRRLACTKKTFFALMVASCLFSFNHLVAMEEDHESHKVKTSRVRDRYDFEYERINSSDEQTKEFYKALARDWHITIDLWERCKFSYIVALSYKRLGEKEKAFHWLKKAGKRGQVEAQLYLSKGFLYGNDEFGIQKNYNKSLKWANRAAKKGSHKGKEYLKLAKSTIQTEQDKKHKELNAHSNNPSDTIVFP